MQHGPGFGGARRLVTLSRRDLFARLGMLAAGASLLAACQPTAPASPAASAPTSLPVAPPTAAPVAKPTTAAAPPTVAPAAQATVAPAAKPTGATVVATSAGHPGGEFILANWDEPISLDPPNINGSALVVANLLYDRLVMLDKDGNPKPWLAESWDLAADGTTYTLHLKKGVKFHDGTPFNAQAVQFNLDRLNAGALKATFLINLSGIYQSTDIVDDYTARIHVKQAFAPFMVALADGFYGMVSPTAMQQAGQDYNQHPVGSGPFIFEEWVPKSHVAAKRNPDYAWGPSIALHQGPAYFDRVSVRLIPDSTVRQTVVETGEAHFAIDIPPEMVEQLKQNADLQVIADAKPGPTGRFDLNTAHFPIDDVRVRQAINWAVNKEELCKVLFNNAFTPARTPLQPGTFGYDETLSEIYPRTDLDQARMLLDQAGWQMGPDGIRQKDGKPLEVTANIVSEGIQALPIKWATTLQSELRQVGIQFSPKQMDTAALFATLTEGSEMVTFAPGQPATDPDFYRALLDSAFYGKSAAARTGYKDAHLDDLLHQGAAESDQTKRKAIYREIQQVMLQQALIVPMWVRKATYLERATVRDVYIEPQGWPNLYDAWLTQT